MPVAAGAAFGVVFQTLLQVAAQISQGLLFAGLLGEGVVQLGQFAGLEVLELDGEAGLAAAGILLGVVLREGAVHGLAVANGHAHHAFHEAGDHAAVLEVHIHRVGTAAFDLAAVIAVGAFEAHHGDVTFFSLATLHWHHRGQLAP